MKRLSTAIACAALYCLTVAAGLAEKQPVIAVRGPTVVAFFEPVPRPQLDKAPDTNEALADFQFYASNVREPFKKAGIEFHEVYAYSFQLREGKRMTTFRPAKVKVGYYLVAPGMKPRIEFGVMTDADLLQLAHEYLVFINKTCTTAVLGGAAKTVNTTLAHWREVEGSQNISV